MGKTKQSRGQRGVLYNCGMLRVGHPHYFGKPQNFIVVVLQGRRGSVVSSSRGTVLYFDGVVWWANPETSDLDEHVAMDVRASMD